MSETLQDKIGRIVRELFDTHLDLFAHLLAEAGVEPEEQTSRLDTLYQLMQRIEYEPTIFEGGRRIALSLSEDEPQVLKLNEELIGRISDAEIVATLGRPIAQVLGLSSLSMTLALKTRDEQSLKSLTTKIAKKAENAPVRAVDVPSYVSVKIGVFTSRLESIAALLGQETSFDVEISDELRGALKGSAAWPEWQDIQDIEAFKGVSTALRTSLGQTKWESTSELIVELLWDSLGLTPHSYFKHAGRAIRGANVSEAAALLDAMFAALKVQEKWLSTELSTWPSFQDIKTAWSELAQNERRAFGMMLHDLPAPSVSVLEVARDAFGLDQPTTLPWELPLVCWTVREQGALRDLFVGLSRTLPIPQDDGYPVLGSLDLEGATLDYSEDLANLGVHLAPIDTEMLPIAEDAITRASAAVISRLCEQFDGLDEAAQTDMLQRIRDSYDGFFPNFREVWERHFFGLSNRPRPEQYFILVTGIQSVLTVPMVIDAFLKPSQDEPSPFPTLTLVVAVQNTEEGVQTPFYVPLSALNSTITGPPIRVRAVRTSPGSGATWLCDRTLALNKLQGQAIELLTRSIHGDSMRLALFT
ncbi:hypothetical protein FRD01_09625 [Microvenator marinus]|uniref:Uncharacterized protein n=1 Tax=Microvenator marinus TaxID=2600177 RepID=A0A5B8XPL7_9DELT|nr:hypothetical protein [Microvenator marinus]QED27494.1 hypothetical protein FRD01_09625 [Microvenator marinus]